MLYCSQVCVAAGRVHQTKTALSSHPSSTDQSSCPLHSALPVDTGDERANCGDHPFLILPSGQFDLPAAGTTVPAIIGFLTAGCLLAKSLPHARRPKLERSAPLAPCYLVFSVLRL